MSSDQRKLPRIQPWTIPTIVLTALVLTLANVTPVWWVRWSCHGDFVGVNEFGWPCVYLWTPLTAAQKTAVTQQGPRQTWLLPAGDVLGPAVRAEGFNPFSLTANLICALFVLLLSGVFVEHVQRIWIVRPQLTVRGMLGITGLAALLLARLCHRHNLQCRTGKRRQPVEPALVRPVSICRGGRWSDRHAERRAAEPPGRAASCGGWNRTNVETFRASHPATERPRKWSK